MSEAQKKEMLKRFLTVIEILREAKQQQKELSRKEMSHPKGEQNHV
jgi:hypothetical protein